MKYIKYFENINFDEYMNKNIDWKFDYEEDKPLTGKEIFFKFLKEKNIKKIFLQRFYNCWNNDNPYTNKSYKDTDKAFGLDLDDYLDNVEPYNYLLYAFSWVECGNDALKFWEYMNKKWKEYYKYEINENINLDEFDYEEEEPNYNKELFFKFLDENDIRKKFIDCFNKSNWINYNPSKKNIDDYFNEVVPEKYIIHAFNWSLHDMGWAKISDEWNEYYKRNKNRERV